MKATHNGTCQICGNEQAVNAKSGKISKHGYTVEWGYFEGTCPGSGELPLQKGEAAARDMMLHLDNQAERDDETRKGEIENVTVLTRDLRKSRVTVNREGYEELGYLRTWESVCNMERTRLKRQAELCRKMCREIEKRIDTIFGTALIERAPAKAKRVEDRREYFQTPRQAYTRQHELEQQGIKSKYMNRNYQPYLIIYKDES